MMEQENRRKKKKQVLPNCLQQLSILSDSQSAQSINDIIIVLSKLWFNFTYLSHFGEKKLILLRFFVFFK